MTDWKDIAEKRLEVISGLSRRVETALAEVERLLAEVAAVRESLARAVDDRDGATASASMWRDRAIDAEAETERLRGALRHQCSASLHRNGTFDAWCEGCPCYEGGNCTALAEEEK